MQLIGYYPRLSLLTRIPRVLGQYKLSLLKEPSSSYASILRLEFFLSIPRLVLLYISSILCK